MSPSEKDLDRQVKRHKGPLLGFVAILVFVAIILVWWIGREFGGADNPRGADRQIDSRTGETVDGPAPDPALERPPQPAANAIEPQD